VVQAVRVAISRLAPAWSGISVASWARYLGFALGPGKGLHSWDKALVKYIDRSEWWGKAGYGLMLTLRAYQVYISSVLGFLCQLEPLPPNFQSFEEQSCRLMAPGPTFWVTPDVLKNLQLWGFSAELKDMAAVSVAAKSRIFRQEDFRNGGLRIRARSQRLDRLLATSTVQHVAWCHTWIPNSFLFYVNDAEKQVEHTIATRRMANDIPPRLQAWEDRNQREGEGVEADEESDESSTVRVQTPTEARRSWQPVAMQLMRQPTLQQTRIHLRRRLDTWDLHTLKGHRVDRAVSILSRASHLVPPRVVAAYLRTICGGWMTSARFGQPATPCRFGCVHGTDSLPHIARCPVVHSLIESEARLQLPRWRVAG